MFTVVMTNGIEDRGADRHFATKIEAATYIANEIFAIYPVKIPLESLIAATLTVNGQNDPTCPGWGWRILDDMNLPPIPSPEDFSALQAASMPSTLGRIFV